jgi:hypothetical protein
MTTVKVKDDLTNRMFEFILQSDNSVLFSDIKRVFGEVCGISIGNVCLSIDDNKILPHGSWKNETYSIIRPEVISGTVQSNVVNLSGLIIILVSF